MDHDTRKVGERGQVTIPQELRERLDIRGGDEVLVHAEGGKIVVEKPMNEEEVAEGYRERSEHLRDVSRELRSISGEADAGLGDAPEW